MLKLITILLAATLVSAVPFRPAARRGNALFTNNTAGSSLLVSGPGYIAGVSFLSNGSFEITSNYGAPGTVPSWLLPKSPTQFYFVDENSDTVSLNFLDEPERITATGSAGLVHLEYNGDRTHMLGAAYGSAKIDIFDITARDGTFSLVGSISSNDTLGPGQTAAHPHQVLLEPSGRFFVANDLGTDTLLVIDGASDFSVVNHYRVEPAGCGPRHGAFHPPPDRGFSQASHYMVVCETLNLILLYKLTYSRTSIDFAPVQNISTFGDAFPPANATSARAGELLLDLDLLARRAHVYVTNRLTGNETDSISCFALSGSTDGPLSLLFAGSVSSGGLVPRSIALSGDRRTLFATNQGGKSGLVALARDRETGLLSPEPLAAMDNTEFNEGQEGFGPQFVVSLPTATGDSSSPMGKTTSAASSC